MGETFSVTHASCLGMMDTAFTLLQSLRDIFMLMIIDCRRWAIANVSRLVSMARMTGKYISATFCCANLKMSVVFVQSVSSPVAKFPSPLPHVVLVAHVHASWASNDKSSCSTRLSISLSVYISTDRAASATLCKCW